MQFAAARIVDASGAQSETRDVSFGGAFVQIGRSPGATISVFHSAAILPRVQTTFM